jgi:hypothetical protein
MSAQSIRDISISRLSVLCWIIRAIHLIVFLVGTSVVPVAIGLLIWQLAKGLPISPLQITCAALGSWLLIYCFRRVSTLRRTAPWQLIALAIVPAAALAYAFYLFSQMPEAESDLQGNVAAFAFLAIAGVLLPIQSALQWWLQQTRLDALGTTIGSIIAPSGTAMRARSISLIKGCVFAAFGVSFLAFQTIGELAATILERESRSYLLFFIGLALLLRSRRYFQADADSLLSVDRRAPILFLRSFADDAKGGWRLILSFFLGFSRLLDYSLELRLAGYFMHFGPFVAVGTPNEKVPQLGAARKSFGEGEWQDAVVGWAKSAQLISIFVGSTKWVNWEISQVISLNLTDRLILLMPESRFWLPWRHSSAMKQRLAMLAQAMASTPWSAAISQVGRARSVRAVVLERDGRISVIRSVLRSRDSYHLAAVIAHHMILKKR